MPGNRISRPSPKERFLKDADDEAERGIDNGGGGDSLFRLSIVVTVDPRNVVSSILTAALRSGNGGGGLLAAAAAASSCSSLISRRRGSEIVWAMKLAASNLLVREKGHRSQWVGMCRARNNGWNVGAGSFFLLLLNYSARPCLGLAYQDLLTFISGSLSIVKKTVMNP